MRSAIRKDEGERGAVLVFTALLLVVMMGFAAIAVDAAAAWSEKREVQTSADMGSLAAIQEIPRTLLADAIADSASAGADFVTRNADATPTVGEPTAGPSCSARPPGFIRPCITNVAVSSDGSSDNSFAPAIGAGAAIDVPASAEAQIDIEYPAMRLLPFGVVEPSGVSHLRCAATSPCLVHIVLPVSLTPVIPDPLPLPVPFGSDDLQVLGIRRLDTGCEDADETTNRNVSLGVDHLVDDDMAAPANDELPACEAGHELTLPNTFRQVANPVAPAAIAADSVTALLSGSEELWDYLTDTSTDLACKRSTYQALDALTPPIAAPVLFTIKTVWLTMCLDSSPGDVLALPSSGHPRLGWAIDESGTRVEGYTPVWIHSVADPLPEALITPSSPNPSGFTVFVLDEGWLPSNLTEVDPGGMDNLTFKLVS